MNSDLVLEIGAGHNPSPAADVVVDKYLFDNTERGGALKTICPTVIADGEHLPFRDKAFAKTVGRQVMEHMDDIGAFFEELMRVSSGGYLAAPSYLREHVFRWPYHKWLICEDDGMLTCARKNIPAPSTGLLFHYLAAHNTHFTRFMKSLPTDILHVQYAWTDQINYRIVDSIDLPDFSTYESIEAYFRSHASPASFANSLKRWMLRWLPRPMVDQVQNIRRAYYSLRMAKARRAINLDALLICPACKHDVQKAQQGYTCKSCGRFYPIQDGVPVFLLTDDATATERP